MRYRLIKNIHLLVLISFSLLTNNISAAKTEEEAPLIEAPKGALGSYQIRETELTLEKLVESNDALKTQYESCKKNKDVGIKGLDACLWDGLKGENGSILIPKLPQNVREEISKKLYSNAEEKDPDGKTADRNKDKFDFDYKNVTRIKDPAFLNLQKYLSERIQKAFYGEDPKNTQMVDHKRFSDLAKARIGKNILHAMSSYCLDADFDNQFGIPKKKDLQKMREKNLKKLSDATSTQKAHNSWSVCIKSIKNICYKGLDMSKDPAPPNPDGSKKRACLVTNYLKTSRKGLIAMEDIDKQWDVWFKKQNTNVKKGIVATDENGKVKKIKKYGDPSQDEKSTDDLISLTSGELTNDSGFKKGVDEMGAELDQCYQNEKIVDQEKCKRFLNTERKKAEDLIAENSARSRAIENKMKEENFKNEKQLDEFLESEGYSEKERKKIIKEKMKDLAKKIQNRYKAERDAVIASLAEQLNNKTSQKEGTIAGEGDQLSLGKIRKELTSRTKYYAQLLHFNNIITSYLSFDTAGKGGLTQENKKGGSPERNTTAAVREVGNSSFSKKKGVKRNVAAKEKDGFQQDTITDNGNRADSLKRTIEQLDKGSKKSDKENSGLSIEQLNKNILNYD